MPTNTTPDIYDGLAERLELTAKFQEEMAQSKPAYASIFKTNETPKGADHERE